MYLVSDNTNIITEQLFQEEVVVTRNEMNDLRNDFDDWMEAQGDKNDHV